MAITIVFIIIIIRREANICNMKNELSAACHALSRFRVVTLSNVLLMIIVSS